MPEYLSPGVYVEEVSFRSESIEGVPTSTTGFAGMTGYGPVQYDGGPKTTEPRLVTSFTEFERTYGELDDLEVSPNAAAVEDRLCYTAHAARAFFLNGGRRLYVSRVFVPRSTTDLGLASQSVAVGTGTATWRSRWPGAYGNVWIETSVTRSKQIGYVVTDPTSPLNGKVQVRRAKVGAVVEVLSLPPNTLASSGNDPLVPNTLAEIALDPVTGGQLFMRGGAAFLPLATDVIQLIELSVLIKVTPNRSDAYTELGADPEQVRNITKILQKNNPEDEDAMVWLDFDPSSAGNDAAAKLMVALQANPNKRLQGGNDGLLVGPSDLAGQDADPDDATKKGTGLAALGEIDDIAIVALPDGSTYENEDDCFTAQSALVTHCENLRYRIAVVDGMQGSSISAIREFRGRFDTKYGALYHPWIEILDPTQRPAQGAPPQRLVLPPSGFVCGIYARSDIARGVYKAPANEVVAGLTKFEANINKGRQDVLNPEGINALRFFEGRGNRVWGARTMSSDPEWKYVNVRRLFIYLEHSIDKSTQWAVFEPNNEQLWANVKQAISDFLYVTWKGGALMGTKPEQAFFVRCDRTTMTQNDLDNGRLIVLIGVAPVYPAEFVIFRIGQFTADSNSN